MAVVFCLAFVAAGLSRHLHSVAGAQHGCARLRRVHALTPRGGHQAVCLRFNDCGLGGLAIHAGGSLAGKDSMDASSTMSSASSSEGGSCASFGAGNLSSGC